MIHEIGVELRAALVANGCPIPVVDGPEKASNTVPRERIVIERDFGQPEPVMAPKGTGRNARHIFDRHLQAKVTIYAQAPGAGSTHFEHLRRADAIADEVLFGLAKVLTSRKNSGFRMGAGRLVEPLDAKGSELPNFAVYELTFTAPRAVDGSTWAGVVATEVALGGVGGVTIGNITRVSSAGDDTPALETACGA